MPDQAGGIGFRRTRHNRYTIPALIAVLEAELGSGAPPVRVADRWDDLLESHLIAYSFGSAELGEVRAELAQLRARGRTLSIAGGPHPSADPEGTLALGFTWAAVGEAGPGFASLVDASTQGRPPLPGVLKAEDRRDLDTYPPWPSGPGPKCPIELSRGCPIGCAFCQTPNLFGRQVRHRSIRGLERVFRSAVDSGVRFTRFVAPNAFGYGSRDGRTPQPQHVRAMLETARDCGMNELFFGTFPSEVRPESVTAEMLAIVRDLCSNRMIAVGVQSGGDAMLRRIRRGHSAADALIACQRIAEASMLPRLDFIFGLPGESAEDLEATRALIARVVGEYGAQVHAHRFVPLPGTPLASERPGELDERALELVAELTGRGQITGVKRRCAPTRVRTEDQGAR